ncbi:hypothetical protein CAOG_07950 [Capsaspora owczarzaki ATCC 30864]|uniref:hypothetical protein n=1 Tax=Capsaspora owczarzaki (strain ATCC 30864) TaxID=595528 RepID=UPI00035240C0|nr:hypothetical protein CAOG_07950 [Capsaspora owczarzaki ATCC 30864]|eukprot:XP_004343038.2 hypothetical protein CAOG_07950 [Capsaspora owczarzaki ATCC 30864]
MPRSSVSQASAATTTASFSQHTTKFELLFRRLESEPVDAIFVELARFVASASADTPLVTPSGVRTLGKDISDAISVEINARRWDYLGLLLKCIGLLLQKTELQAMLAPLLIEQGLPEQLEFILKGCVPSRPPSSARKAAQQQPRLCNEPLLLAAVECMQTLASLSAHGKVVLGQHVVHDLMTITRDYAQLALSVQSLFEIVRCLNTLLSTCQENMVLSRNHPEGPELMKRVAANISNAGDFEFQRALVELCFRIGRPDRRDEWGAFLFADRPLAVQFASIASKTFLTDARTFVNKLNDHMGIARSVDSFQFVAIQVQVQTGNDKPRVLSYKDMPYWFDLNMAPRTLSFDCPTEAIADLFDCDEVATVAFDQIAKWSVTDTTLTLQLHGIGSHDRLTVGFELENTTAANSLCRSLGTYLRPPGVHDAKQPIRASVSKQPIQCNMKDLLEEAELLAIHKAEAQAQQQPPQQSTQYATGDASAANKPMRSMDIDSVSVISATSVFRKPVPSNSATPAIKRGASSSAVSRARDKSPPATTGSKASGRPKHTAFEFEDTGDREPGSKRVDTPARSKQPAAKSTKQAAPDLSSEADSEGSDIEAAANRNRRNPSRRAAAKKTKAALRKMRDSFSDASDGDASNDSSDDDEEEEHTTPASAKRLVSHTPAARRLEFEPTPTPKKVYESTRRSRHDERKEESLNGSDDDEEATYRFATLPALAPIEEDRSKAKTAPRPAFSWTPITPAKTPTKALRAGGPSMTEDRSVRHELKRMRVADTTGSDDDDHQVPILKAANAALKAGDRARRAGTAAVPAAPTSKGGKSPATTRSTTATTHARIQEDVTDDENDVEAAEREAAREMDELVSALNTTIHKAATTKKSRAQSLAQQTVAANQKKLLKLWKVQRGERAKLNEELQTKFALLVAANQKAQDSLVEAIQAMMDTHQQFVAATQGEIAALFAANTSLSDQHDRQTTAAHLAMQNELTSVHNRLIKETQSTQMGNLRKSLESMMSALS